MQSVVVVVFVIFVDAYHVSPRLRFRQVLVFVARVLVFDVVDVGLPTVVI